MNDARKKELQARIDKLKTFSVEEDAINAARLLNKSQKNLTYAVFSLQKEFNIQFVIAETTDWECLNRLGYEMKSHKLYD